MSFKHIETLEVRLNGQSIGALSVIPNSAEYAFQYFPKWVQEGFSISPLLLPLNNEVFNFGNLNSETYKFLPPAIADSLPDRFGNSLIDAHLAKLGTPVNEITSLDRLGFVGETGLGALEFYPIQELDSRPSDIIEISQMVNVAKSVVFGEINSDSSSKKALANLLSIGTSAGGARPKAVININPKTGEITSGQFAKKGLEPWIIKFDGIGQDKQLGESQEYGRIEYAYSLMAKSAGINFLETKLHEENGRAHFMTRRFDRSFDLAGNPKKIHMQSLCAMSAVDFNLIGINDYAQLFVTMRRLECSEEEITEAFRRMVFNFATNNCDDHSKNFSFLLDEALKWHLSPAYDITFAYDSSNRWLSQHLMGVLGKFQDISRKEFLDFASRFEVQEAKYAIKQVNEAVKSWNEFAKTAKISLSATSEISNLHRIIE